MTYTAVPTKTNGVSNITAAECNTYIRNNIDDLAKRPSAKAPSSGTSSLSTATEQAMDLDVAGQEWDTGSVADTLNDDFNLGASRAGVWYIGARAEIAASSTGDRYIKLDRQGGTTWAWWKDRSTNAGKHRFVIGTATEYVGTEEFECRLYQNSGSSKAYDGAMWAHWIGGTTSTTHDVDNLELSDTQGVTAWWNSWDDNVNRLYNRPAARAYLNTNYTTLADATWTRVPLDTEDYDNHAIIGAGTEYRLTAQVGGWYYVSGGAQISSFTGTLDYIALQFRVNGTGYGFPSWTYNVNSGAGANHIEQIVRLESGDYIELWINKGTTGGNSTIAAGNSVHCGMFLVSGDYPTLEQPRQFFDDGAPTYTNFDFTQPTQGKLPRGLANICTRDLFLHLWNPAVIGVDTLGGSELDSLSEGWTSIRFDRVRFDAWGRGQVSASSSGLTIPYDGIWLVVYTVGVDGVAVSGNDVGMKIRQNGTTRGWVRTEGGDSSQDWYKTSSMLVNAAQGDEITLEVFQNTGDETDLVSASLTAVWMSERP